MNSDDGPLPIFPLANVVLFPHVQAPLQLFEPRYRQLAKHVLDGSRRIGMVVVVPEHVAEMAGDPPVFPVGCAGVITRAQELSDGRYNLVLLGTHRFRIVRELERSEERLYRVAEVERLVDAFEAADSERVDALRSSVLGLVRDLLEGTEPERARRLTPDLLRNLEAAKLVNALSNAFALPAQEKQGLLEADSIPERFERLSTVLRFLLAERFAGAPANPGTLH